ncbi:MAG: ABC transporter permease [Brachybacterium sp.]|nr:ABC transporter permease [Brachybacterium sp.]
MSAPVRPETNDQVVHHDHVDERSATWWHLPLFLGVMGVFALLVFGFGAPGGATSTLRIATESDLNPANLIPLTLAFPTGATGIALGVVCLVIAAVLGVVALRATALPRWVRTAMLVLFGFLWVLAFLVWVVSNNTMNMISVLAATMALAVPLAFGALSGVLSERSGVINIAIEGQLIFGAFGAALIASVTGSPWAGLIAAPIMALGVGALLGLFAIGNQVQQIIVGVVLNVFAIGLTAFFLGTVMNQDPSRFNAPMRLPNIRIPVLADLPLVGRALFDQTILVYLMLIIVAVLTVALFRTRWGLHVRAVGEHPKAADTVGINVNATRWRNVLLGSAVAGLGGATLTIGTGVAFADEMSAGKGYIALAAMILGRYHPVGALAAALMFAFADALQQNLGSISASAVDGAGVSIPSQLLLMLPYLVTLFAVAGVVGRVRVPAANGKPYVKQ